MQNKPWRYASLGALLVLLVGCGKADSHDPTARVSGRVTYAGRAVPEGRVLFYPADGRRMAMGALDSSGSYTLTTFDPGDGAFLGQHTVVIEAMSESRAGPTSVEQELENADPEFVRLVPAKYSSRKTTPLTAEVQESDNQIDFDLPEQ